MAGKEGSARWLLPLALAALVSGIGGVAWAVRAGFKADEAYTTAKQDHDAITRLETLVPRLEKAIDKLDARGK